MTDRGTEAQAGQVLANIEQGQVMGGAAEAQSYYVMSDLNVAQELGETPIVFQQVGKWQKRGNCKSVVSGL